MQEKPFFPRGVAFGLLVVRASGDARTIAAAVRMAIQPAVSGDVEEPEFIDHDYRPLTAGRRFNAGVMGGTGFIAFLLGAIGVFGTMAFVVAQQIPAIGLRVALGASPGGVLRSVLWVALRRGATGVGIAIAAAWALSNAATSFVFGIRPTEPLVFAGVAAFVLMVAVGAALVPATRAARVDPLVALTRN